MVVVRWNVRRLLVPDQCLEVSNRRAMHIAGQERYASTCLLSVSSKLDDEAIPLLFVTLSCPVVILKKS